jgi:hypothetical protein
MSGMFFDTRSFCVVSLDQVPNLGDGCAVLRGAETQMAFGLEGPYV